MIERTRKVQINRVCKTKDKEEGNGERRSERESKMRGIMDSGRIGKIRVGSWHVRIHSEHEFGSIRQWSDAIGFTIFRRSISYSFSTVDWICEEDIFKVFRICTRYLKRRTFSRLFKSEEQCFIEYIPRIQISASIFSFIIISLSCENVFHIFQISCKSLGQTAIFRPNNFDSKENRSIETCSFSLFLPERIKFKNLWGRERGRIYLETIKFVPG